MRSEKKVIIEDALRHSFFQKHPTFFEQKLMWSLNA